MIVLNFRPKGPKKTSRPAYLQKFVFSEGFICCHNNEELVLGVKEVEGRISEVVLCKKKIDDVFQRWVINEDGYDFFIIILITVSFFLSAYAVN